MSSIYLSYAWSDKLNLCNSREKIVDDLYQSLVKDGYHVIRDKIDSRYKDSISEFMKEIGKGKLIVVIISDKYLRSANCMFELLEIYRKSGSEILAMKEKIFPIVLSDAKIYDPIDRLGYVAFWKAKKEELDKKVRKVGLEYAADIVDDFKVYSEIASNISLLINLLQDLNNLDPEVMSDNNFITIKNAIVASVSGNTPASKTKKGNGDSESFFNVSQIRKFLTNALSDTELNSLCMDQFEKVYNSFADGMSKTQKINFLLDHCKRNLKMGKLLEAMKETNSDQFKNYEPYL